MINSLCFGIRFVTRFVFISLIFITLLIGGYLSIWHKDNSLIEEFRNPIIEKIEKITDINIEFKEIKEKWGLNTSKIIIPELKLENKDFNIKAKDIKLGFKTIESIKNKEILITSIKVKDLDILLKGSKEKFSQKEKEQKIKNTLEKLKKLSLNIENITFKMPSNEINLTDLKILKEKDSNYTILSYKDKIEIQLTHEIKKDIFSFNSEIKTNNFYLKKIFKLSGNQKLLDFIHFDKMYKIVGDLKANINFDYDLSKEEFTDYKIDLALNGNKVILKDYDSITLTNTIGNLYYDKKGFYSNKIKGSLNKRKTYLEIEQKSKDNIIFSFETSADIKKLSEIARFPLDKILKGRDSFKGYYELNFNKKDKLHVESDFEKIDFINKPPFETTKGFELNGYFDYDKEQMNFNISQGKNSIKLNFIEGKFYNVGVGINKKSTRKQTEKGFFIFGEINNVDVFDLVDYLDKTNDSFKGYDKQIDNDFETNINLSLFNAKVETQVHKEINFSYQNNILALTIDEELASGYLYFNQITNEIDIMLDKMKVIPSDAKNIIENKIDKEKAIETIKTVDYKNIFNKNYKINIDIKDLYIGEDDNSHTFKANGYIENGFLLLDKILVTDKNDNFEINTKYTYDSIKNFSKLEKLSKDIPLIEIKNIKNIQKSNGLIENQFETEGIILDGELSWMGFKPLQMGKTMNGNLNLEVKKGYIPKNFTGVGFLKTINLFNFDSWLKMFTFNFEEIESGLHFNSIKGGFKINKNVVNIEPRIVLDSDLFILEFKGNMNYIENTYDLNIDAIVPILNKAPAIALFAGVAPEVVGVIWLIDKLAGDFISETFTRTKFNVSGSFDNPIYTKEKSETFNLENFKEEQKKENKLKEKPLD